MKLASLQQLLDGIPFLQTLAAASQPIVLIVVFWVLWLLWVISAFAPPDNITYVRGGKVVVAVLLGILGFCVFGFS